MKIDLHTHILPENWPSLRDKYGYGGFVQLDHHAPCRAKMHIDGQFFREIASNCWDPAARIKECDETRVQMQVLSTVPVMFSYWAKPEHCLDLSMLLNDHIAGIVREHPTRFSGLGTIPMQDADLAIRELERCVKQLGLPGVEIGSNINDRNLNDPAFFPIFEAAQELGAAIFVHPWEVIGKDRMPKYWLPWLVGMPATTAMAICCMIFGGVFERLPRLKVCFAHCGGSFPFTIGRIQHGFDVRPDLCAIDNAIAPTEYIGKFYMDTLVHDPDALRFVMNRFGANRLAMGSDYPFPLGEAVPGAMIESMTDLTPYQRERMLWGTAAEFLSLRVG